MNNNAASGTEPPDWRALRDQEHERRRAQREQARAERRAAGGSIGSFVGVILIAVGVILILQNLYSFPLRNWWALFILIPAAGSLATAWGLFTRGGVFGPAVIGPFIAGIVLLAVTAAFLFELNWTILGPVLLILIGVGALVSAVLWPRG